MEKKNLDGFVIRKKIENDKTLKISRPADTAYLVIHADVNQNALQAENVVVAFLKVVFQDANTRGFETLQEILAVYKKSKANQILCNI